MYSDQSSLSSIGDKNCTLSDIINQATPFILSYLVQVKLSTEILFTQCLTRQGFQLITSRSWHYISCHWDTCTNHSAISNFKRNVLPHYLWGLRWFQMHRLSDKKTDAKWQLIFFFKDNLGQKYYSPQFTPTACYGQTKCMTMTETREKMWAKKVSRNVASAPKLSSLLPTTDLFAQNDAGTSARTSGSLEESDGTKAFMNGPKGLWMGISSWQWDVSGTYFRLMISHLHQMFYLKSSNASCSGEIQCKTKGCWCRQTNLACAVLCACQEGHRCFNDKTSQICRHYIFLFFLVTIRVDFHMEAFFFLILNV